MKNFNSIFLIFCFFLTSSHASDVAKVILARGEIRSKLKDGSIVSLKEQDSVSEGDLIQTADKSFIKLIFIDKSTMNLGPNSQIVISSFPKDKAGIISLVKGQLRSQVTKNYMDIKEKDQSKLYIKTKTAALGIRGTDFQVNYNPENMNTSLITFEGRVAMSDISKKMRDDVFDQRRLEATVSSERAVMVGQGQISAVNLNLSERVMDPTMLGVKQIEALKKNEFGQTSSNGNGGDERQYRNPVPAGLDGVTFSNVSKEINHDEIKKQSDGYFNPNTGEYKMPAGSIIDLKTVNIIPPPLDAVFDPNTKTYVVPETFGKVDKATGEYKAPVGLELSHDGKFKVIDPDAFTKSQEVKDLSNKEDLKKDIKEEMKDEKKEDKKEDKRDEKKTDDKKEIGNTSEPTRAISSEATPEPSKAPVVVEAPKLYDAPVMADFANKFSDVQVPNRETTIVAPTVEVTPTLLEAATQVKSSTETIKQTTIDQGISNLPTKVNFKLNVK